jgi:hypothetical protein
LAVSAVLSLSLACEALKPVEFDQNPVETGIDAPVDSDDPSDDTDDTTPSNPDNNAPRANAGPDQIGLDADQAVLLDGSASSDLDGDPLDFEWRLLQKPPGSIASITNATSITSQIYIDRPGDYRVELYVSDGIADDVDGLLIRVDEANEQPLADAGFDQFVSQGAQVQLSGAGSYDPDGDQLDYIWSFVSRPPGSVATLAGATVQPALNPRFLADVPGVYTVQLEVDDGEWLSEPDLVNITAQETGSSGGSGGSGSTDCLDCAAQVEDELNASVRAGDAASAIGLLSLPMFLLLVHRRRGDD